MVEKRGLIPPDPDVSLTLISLVEKRCLIHMESIVPPALNPLALATSRTLLLLGSPSVLLSMVEHSSHLQNENWLREVQSLNTTFFTLWLPTIGLSPFGIIPTVARRVLSEDYNSSESCPLRGS